jgi:hypothetical protein
VIPFVIAVVALLILGITSVYLVWLGGRHDRLTARADGAWAALDAQLARRAAASHALAVSRGEPSVLAAASAVLHSGGETAPSDERQDAENSLGRAIRRAGWETLDDADAQELRSAAQRVLLARQFHNDAVRDLQAIRRRPVARLARWARGGTQRYFEIDDTVLTGDVRREVPRSAQ